MGNFVVDPLVRFLLAVVAPKVLGVRLALAVVVVDSLAVVYSLADLGLVVDSRVVGRLDLGLVVGSVDLLALLVADCPQTRPPVAAG